MLKILPFGRAVTAAMTGRDGAPPKTLEQRSSKFRELVELALTAAAPHPLPMSTSMLDIFDACVTLAGACARVGRAVNCQLASTPCPALAQFMSTKGAHAPAIYMG